MQIALLLTALFVLLLPAAPAQGQSAAGAAPDGPYRSFEGDWAGTISVNPGKLPPTVTISIHMLPGQSGMLWRYTFGKPGEPLYRTAEKRITLDPQAETLVSQWNTDKKPKTCQTQGLAAFTRTGQGQFAVSCTITYRAGLRQGAMVELQIISLSPTHLEYTWQMAGSPRASLYSHFVLDRVVAGPAVPPVKEGH